MHRHAAEFFLRAVTEIVFHQWHGNIIFLCLSVFGGSHELKIVLLVTTVVRLILRSLVCYFVFTVETE